MAPKLYHSCCPLGLSEVSQFVVLVLSTDVDDWEWNVAATKGVADRQSCRHNRLCRAAARGQPKERFSVFGVPNSSSGAIDWMLLPANCGVLVRRSGSRGGDGREALTSDTPFPPR